MIISELFEAPQQCPECGGISFSNLILAEKKDACYHKVKASAKVWPSAYASGRLVQCRKKGAANYGNKSEGVAENNDPYEPEAYDEFVSDTYSDDNPEDEQGVAEGLSTDNLLAKSGFKEIRKMKHGAVYSNGHEAVSIRIDPSDLDVINWALGEVTGKRIEWFESGNDDKQEALHIIKTFIDYAQGVAEEYELAGVGVAYELGRRAYRERKTIRDNPYSATKEARKYDEWEKGLERGKHDANDAKLFRNSVREQGMAEGVMYGAENLNVGDDVIVSGNVEFNGATGVIDSFGQDKRFVVVNLFNHGPHSFHSSDVSANDYDNDEHDDRLNEKSVSQAQFRTMAGAAHNPKFARKVGISQDVAQEFNRADKKSNYKKLPVRATEGAPVTTTPGSINPGGAVDNFKQQMANNTEVAYQEKLSGVGEGEQQKGADYRDPKEVDYDDEYDAMVARVRKLAGLGPMKTVYDPNKRVYRNVPTAVQPKK
jgi:hypothetical protein